MEPVDYVALVLGILLLGLIVGLIIVALLVKKGVIYGSNKQQKVQPSLRRPVSRVSRLNTSLYRQTPEVRSKQSVSPRSYTEKPRLDDTGPIIYLNNDIYRPPGTLPLPPHGKVSIDDTHSFYGIYKHKHDPRKYKSRIRQAAHRQPTGGATSNGVLPQDDGISAITSFGRCDPYCDVKHKDRKRSVLM